MRRKLLAMVLPALMTTSAFAVEGEHSTVNFTGNVVEPTCALTSESHDQVVDMGTVSTNAFTGKNSSARRHGFTIGVEGCKTNFNLRFIGENDGIYTLKTTNNDVGIRLYGPQPSPERAVPLDGSTPGYAKIPNDSAVYMNYTAEYVALGNQVSPGEANALVNFYIDYG